MNPSSSSRDSFSDAPPAALVSFSVVCQSSSGTDLERLRRDLSLETLKRFWPTVDVRAGVVAGLKRLGFEVFDGTSPVVAARGTVRRFEEVFGARLALKTAQRAIPGSDRVRPVTSIVLREDSDPPSPNNIPGALLVTVAEKPDPAAPSLPQPINGFNLRLPGDIAQLTGASATHRLSTPLGTRATGEGVVVAVVDSGFGNHPYYVEHGYRITRVAAADVSSSPAQDDDPHGTLILAGLFACAPDAHVVGIKYGDNPGVALEGAMAIPGLKVVSLSWGYDLEGKKALPSSPVDLLPLQVIILTLISNGVTVVASAGNGQTCFPAMMPEVIAVGGVDVDAADALAAWDGGSSFLSAIFKGRGVPDLCGLAARMMLPIPAVPADPGPPPLPASPAGWASVPGGTSLATCQVAGVAALLLQKDPTLTPRNVRAALMSTSTDVVAGQTASKHAAGPGPDLATGSGFVNALTAWNSV